MSQVLFVCGPDRCGKTQIARELSRLTRIPYFKASSEHKAFLGDQRAFIDEIRHADPRMVDFIEQTGMSVIFDRGFPCEGVYSLFFKRPTDAAALRHLDEAYAKLGARVLICTRRSFAGVVDDLNPKLGKDALEEISRLYQLFATYSRCQTHTMYVDDEDLERETNEALTFMGYDENTIRMIRTGAA